jgi:hypothetical protein
MCLYDALFHLQAPGFGPAAPRNEEADAGVDPQSFTVWNFHWLLFSGFVGTPSMKRVDYY